MQVTLAEGPWPDEAYDSAAKQSRRFRPRLSKRGYTIPCPVSRGPYDQASGEGPPFGSPPPPDDFSTPEPQLPHAEPPAEGTDELPGLQPPGPPAVDQSPREAPLADLYREPPLAAPAQPPTWHLPAH